MLSRRRKRHLSFPTKRTNIQNTTHDIYTIIHVPIHCLSKRITIFEKEEKEIGEGVKVHLYKYMRLERTLIKKEGEEERRVFLSMVRVDIEIIFILVLIVVFL